ncbi:hypothetical protein [Streptomyces parvulus]|uniref:hypothetical protein n=1 Tax=Streptomyces parvulus TaxID=146923 RepID=UPI003F4CF62D
MAVVLPGHLAAVALAARSDAVAPVPLAEPGAALSPLMEQAAVMGLRLLDIPLPLPPIVRRREAPDGSRHERGATARLRVPSVGTRSP